MSLGAGDSSVAEPRDLQPYDPDEANRQLRSMLQDTVQQARQGGKWLVRSQLVVAAATILAMGVNGVTAWLTYEQIVAVRTSTEQTPSFPNPSVPRPSPQGTPEALPSPILRGMSRLR
jgi:hypothetical protein